MLELLQHRPLPARRVVSPGSSSTGSRLIVASAAPVTMLVAPGPIEEVHASVARRRVAFAKPAAVCTIDCSLRPWKKGSSVAVLVERLPDARARCRARRCRSIAGISRCRSPSRSLVLHLQVADERLGRGQPDRRRRAPGNDNRRSEPLLRAGEWDRVTPESAGWRYLSFCVERLAGAAERAHRPQETAIVLLAGRLHGRGGRRAVRARPARRRVRAAAVDALPPARHRVPDRGRGRARGRERPLRRAARAGAAAARTRSRSRCAAPATRRGRSTT